MEEIAGNRYNYKADIELLDKQYTEGTYKEDQALFSKNLFIVLGKITNEKPITKFVERIVEFRKMSNASYLFLKDIIKMIETEEVVNFSKYDGMICFESGMKREAIKIKIIRNRETEFVNIISKIDTVGMISLLKALSNVERV